MTTTYDTTVTKSPRNVSPWYVRIAPNLPKIMAWILVVFLWAVMAAVFRINMVPYGEFFGAFPFLAPWFARSIIAPAACGAFQVIQVWPQFIGAKDRDRYRKSLKYSKYAFILEACFSFVIWWPDNGWMSISVWEALYTLAIIIITVFGFSVTLHLTNHYLVRGGRD